MTHPLRAWRTTHQITLVDLARRVGVSPATISRIEARVMSPSMRLVADLLRVTDGALSADDFLPEPKPMEAAQ